MIKNIVRIIGLDKAIIFTSSTSILNALGSVISVLLVVKFMNNIEQGYYYTFGSIVAIQIFFELGFNSIITQYVAHENAHLVLDENKKIDGPLYNKSRITSLLHFSIKWYSFFSLFLFITLLIIGYLFFSKFNIAKNNNWLYPWILLAIGTSFNLYISPIVAFLQGLGMVKEVSRYQFVSQIIRLLTIWIGLYFGFGLFVLGIGSILYFFIILYFIIKAHKKLLYNFYNIEISYKVNYYKEIFPYQWKIAVSWISGYFIFQLFNPVLFATEGPQVAGQMGLTLTALNGILSLSLAWINTKVPYFSSLIAKEKYEELDFSFNRTLRQSLGINIFLLTILTLTIASFHFFNFKIDGKPLFNRFLGFLPLFFMMIPILLNQLVASWATYLRCHKKEPFLLNSIVGGVLCTFSTFFGGKFYGVIGITFGYMLINIIMLPWSYSIFIKMKKLWH